MSRDYAYVVVEKDRYVRRADEDSPLLLKFRQCAIDLAQEQGMTLQINKHRNLDSVCGVLINAGSKMLFEAIRAP